MTMTQRKSSGDERNCDGGKPCEEFKLPFPLPFPTDSDENQSERGNLDNLVDDNDAPEDKQLFERLQNEQEQSRNGDVTKGTTDEKIKIDHLSPDLFALVCCSLTVQDIASLATCSKALHIACSNQDLWRQKFLARWNYDDPTVCDWFSAYQQAYFNPHDLWITHWNCVDPCDGLGPGRCCIRGEKKRVHNYKGIDRSKKTMKNENEKQEGFSTERHQHKHLCPICRYHPCLEIDTRIRNRETPIGISTVAQAIEAATNLRVEESSHVLPCKPYSPTVAKHAFTKASTLHRSLDYRQYEENSLYFLADLLFFHVYDDQNESSSNGEPFEMREWKEYVKKMKTKNASVRPVNNQDDRRAQGRNDHHPIRDCDTSEPALHSWHLVNICNPDHNRPIVWRISVQRSDCFTVFPSEGYLLPGESKTITFGLTPFGSLIAYAAQQVNVHREGVDEFWANLYEEESHLPCKPFLFHYHFAPSIPCQRADNIDLSLFQQYQQHQQQQGLRSQQHATQSTPNLNFFLNQQTNIGSQWDQSTFNQIQPVRTFCVAGHVHTNYSLSTFRRKTLVPFILPRQVPTGTDIFLKRYLPLRHHSTFPISQVVFCSPQLMEFYPAEWQRLQALRFEDQRNQSVLASKYRTESACWECGLTWGPRMEELGQAFVLAKLESEISYQRCLQRFQCIYRTLKCLVIQYEKHRHNYYDFYHWNIQNQHIVKCLQRKVTNCRGTPLLTKKEMHVLLQWEVILDLLSRYQASDDAAFGKKKITTDLNHYGVYRYPTCTDSVFDRDSAFDRDTSDLLIHPDMISWKIEPRHLELFSHLGNSPGKFCFLREIYKRETKLDLDTLSLTGKGDDNITDIFMNDKISGLKAALSVLADPRSLLVHGLFDKIPYPGRVFRRCKLPVLPKLDEERCLNKIKHRHQILFCSLITSSTQFAHYKVQDSLDLQSLLIVNSLCSSSCDAEALSHSFSLRNFIKNIPSPGNGRFALSTAKCDIDGHESSLSDEDFWFLEKYHSKVTELILEEEDMHGLTYSTKKHEESEAEQSMLSQEGAPRQGAAFDLPEAPGVNNAMLPRGPRILNILWIISSQFGWTVDNNDCVVAVYVDRRILIATHWLSITLAFLPLLVTLSARYFQLIPAIPTSYQLEGLPYHAENKKMRFLTVNECFHAGWMLLFFYCVLGRYIERYTRRDFLRAMQEHFPVAKERNILHRLYIGMFHRGERVWDALCPSVLQRLIFLPQWNRRKHIDLMRHISFWRSQEWKERRSKFRAIGGRGGIFFEERDESLRLGNDCAMKKILAGIIMVLVGFSFGSPHFSLNSLSVFLCSVGFGTSLSLQTIGGDRSGVTYRSTGSIVKSFSLVTAVIFGLLVGQLVGSSGGAVFLAEFAITSISLLLGGMGTISASGMETWGTFFCLSITAFWGYLFGRCSVIENMLKKKVGISSLMLCISVYLVFSLLFIYSVGYDWETVVDIVIKKTHVSEESPHMLP